MDAYLHTKLDQLRDTQKDHGAILDRLLKAAEVKVPAGLLSGLTQKLNLSPFSKMIAQGALMWGVGVILTNYLRSGGDLIKVIEILLKLFG